MAESAPPPDAAPATPAGAVPAQPDKPPKTPFAFTDDGCRTEIRLGGLLILAGVFLWLWLGPQTSSLLYFIGLPLVLIGVPIQAMQARRDGRPGYPWKLGLAFTLGGLAMCLDLRYREVVGATVDVQPVAPMLLAAGVWITAWWPFARRRPAVTVEVPA